jgi:hypothetical protein
MNILRWDYLVVDGVSNLTRTMTADIGFHMVTNSRQRVEIGP